MSRTIHFIYRAATAVVGALLFASAVNAQTGYGVDSTGALFSFDLHNNLSVVTPHGNLGFVPEGIDFRPGTATLYAIDVNGATTTLYTVDITTGTPTAVGAGFPTTVAGAGGYDLTNQRLGFDFNPKTLQAVDQSMRIRVVATNNDNLRLHSLLGTVAVVDSDVAIGTNSPFVDAVAYINNIPATSGVTELYDMDSRNDSLYEQDPPNAGTLLLKGAFNVTDVIPGIHFDIFTTPGSADDTIGGDFGYAVFKRPDSPIGGQVPLGSYLLYNVNLATGETSMGRAIGPAATPRDFDGGFSILPIPEPASAALWTIALLGLAGMRRRMC